MNQHDPNYNRCQASTKCPMLTMQTRCEFHPFGMKARDIDFVCLELQRNKLLVDYYTFLQTVSIVETLSPDIAATPWPEQYLQLWHGIQPTGGSYVDQIRCAVLDAVMPGGFNFPKSSGTA